MDWIRLVTMVCIFQVVSVDTVWWAVLDPSRICRKTRRLRGKTLHICKNEPDVVNAIKRGATLGLKECRYQFQNRRWNCTVGRRSLRKILMKDTRETGFVNAITAAGVTYEVTKACTSGSLNDCPCQPTNPRSLQSSMNPGGSVGNVVGGNPSISEATQFGWGGCGDNVQFGYDKAKEFLEERFRKRSDVKTMVLRHNYEAGRMAVKNYMQVNCKCHGMSGSCAVKSCLRKLPVFRAVGNRIKEKFDGAAKVTAGNDGKSFLPEGGSTIKPPDTEDIVYSEESPDFCVANKATGSLGTKDRVCNHTSMGVEGCELLCCGRGYTTSRVTVDKNCKCRFVWCCDVKCEVCPEKLSISRCM